MRKIILVVCLCVLSIHAKKINDSKSLSTSQTIKDGFYFYKDYADANKTKKAKASPKDQMEASLMKELIDEMKENNRLQKKILKRLEYAYPDTIPKFTVNKKTGEKCRSNSSADCFVMPVIAEAQNSVPVMAKMLRDPSTENIKKYLEWQAVYFNQAFTVGKGFSLVSKQYEREINKLDGMGYTQKPNEQNKQNILQNIKKFATVKKLDNKLGLMVFLGKSREHERNKSGKEYTSIIYSAFKDMKNITFVYESKEDKAFVENKIKKYKYDDDWNRWSKVQSVIKPKEFKRFKINVTPATVAIYKKNDGSVIWQKLGYTMNARQIITVLYRFLSFHKIVKPGNVNEKENWEIAENLRAGEEIPLSAIDAIDINESSIRVTNDQYLKKPKKIKKDKK